jgi:SNF2 family DNA or RNA helicase
MENRPTKMRLHEQSGSVLLHVPDPFAICELIPDSTALLDHPQFNLAVQYGVETTRILANLGYTVPTGALANYNWPGKYKPFDHQRDMAEFLCTNPRAFNLSEMGTGKTAGTLWAADALMKAGEVKRAVILTPLSTVDRVWKHDIFDVLMHRHTVIVHGNAEYRKRMIQTKADFYIINHDGLQDEWLVSHIRSRSDIDLIIVDEASKFRNRSTEKYRQLVKTIREDTRLWLLTGTPCPNAPTDAWALARLVSPQRVPMYYGEFERRTMRKVSRYKWVPAEDAYTQAYNAMQPAIRYLKKDCLDLPPLTFEERDCGLTKEQLQAFERMRISMVTEAENQKIMAMNAADKVGKLRQILCGAIKNPDTEAYVALPHGPRLRVLLDSIEEAAAKVVVIVPFKGIIRFLAEEVGKHYSCEIVNGDVTPRKRDEIFRKFKHEPDPQVLLCHPAVMSHGLNLTEADRMIFYAPIYSNDEYQQVKDRINRAGQTKKMTIVKIGAHRLEWQIYDILDRKNVTQDNILNLYKSVIHGD